MGTQESKIKVNGTTISNSKDKIYAAEAKMRLGSFKKGSSKKRDSLSPQSNASTNSGNTPIRQANSKESGIAGRRLSFRHSDFQNGNAIRSPNSTVPVPTMKTPPVRKTPTPRRSDSALSIQKTKDSNQNGIVNKSSSATNNSVNSNTNSNNNNNNNNNINKVKSLQGVPNNRSPRSVARTNGVQQIKIANTLPNTNDNTIELLLKQLKHNSRAFESLAVLLNYCTNDLNAFSTPLLKRNLEEEKAKYNRTKLDLENLQECLKRLEENIADKENLITDLKNDNTTLSEESDQFRRLVETLKAEESNLKVKLSIVEEELRLTTEAKILAESSLLKECENSVCLKRDFSERIEKLNSEKEILLSQNSEIKKENGILKSANKVIKAEYDTCLSENQRLVNVCSKIKNDSLNSVEKSANKCERDVQNLNGDIRKETLSESFGQTLSISDKPSAFNSLVTPNRLESEVESLRQVLALKTDEVTELRRQELLLRENADRVPKLLSTITMLEGKVEDLQTQLSSQTETVRDLHKNNEIMEEQLKTANLQKTRLTHKNEELQYKLKQYAEAMKQLANQKNLSECSIRSDFSPLKTNPRKDEDCLDDNGRSQMKGVVEKSDSVSYMLEMTEDTSEIVSNIVRRAESMRSSNRCQTLPKKKRTKTLSLSSTEMVAAKRSSIDDFHPNTASTPNSSPTSSFDYDTAIDLTESRNASLPPCSFSIKKAVKLCENDFAIDCIELTDSNNCEIIEITESFDKTDKNTDMVSSTSSTSSKGSHFDIESDIYLTPHLDNDQNNQEVDDNTESSEIQEMTTLRTFRRDAENIKPILPIYKDIETTEEHSNSDTIEGEVNNGFLSSSKSFIKIPKVSGGEAMIGLSSDDEEVDKIK